MSYKDVIRYHKPMLYRLSDNTLNSGLNESSLLIGSTTISTNSDNLSTFIGGSGVGTLACKVYLYGYSNEEYIRIIGTDGSFGIFIKNNQVSDTPIDLPTFYFYSSAGAPATIPILDIDEPMHLCMTWNTTSQLTKVFLNGILINSVTNSTAPAAGVPLYIGRNSQDKSSMTISNIATYNRELSESEVATLASGTMVPTPTGFWPCNEGTGSTLLNSGGSAGININLSNPVWGPDKTTWTNYGGANLNAPPIKNSTGTSAYFNGSQAIAGSTNIAPRYVYGDFVIEFWVKAQNIKATMSTNQICSGSAFGYGVDQLNVRDPRELAVHGSTISTYGIERNVTCHVAIVANSKSNMSLKRQHQIYLNGELVTFSPAVDNSFLPPIVPLYMAIGGRLDSFTPTFYSDQGLDGYISDFAVYRGTWKNYYAKMHYLAATDTQNENVPLTLLKAKRVSSDAIKLIFSKPTFEIKQRHISGFKVSEVLCDGTNEVTLKLYKPPFFHARLNETSGAFVDSISGNQSISVGAGVTRNGTTRISSPAATFSGAGSIKFNQQKTKTSKKFTASVWIKPSTLSFGAICYVVGNYNPSNQTHGWHLGFDTSGYLYARYNTQTISTTYPAFFTPNQWTHFSITYNDETSLIYLYINGRVCVGSNTIGNANITSDLDQPLYIGNELNTAFSGAVQDLMLFDYDLTDEEIKNLYRESLKAFCSDTEQKADGQDTTIVVGYGMDAYGNTLAPSSVDFNNSMVVEDIELNYEPVDVSLVGYTGNLIQKKKYKMRGFNSSTEQFYYWTSTDSPDWTGTTSGIDNSLLTDIIMISKIEG